jgi:hypothetical protein
VGNVENEPRFFHGGACGGGLANPLVRQFHVVPTREQIELIPRTLAVTKKDKGASHGVDGRRRGYFSGIWRIHGPDIWV